MYRALFRGFVGMVTVMWPALLAAAEPASRPNIVILLADDLGYADLGFQGGTEIATPHIDALASNGIRFTNGYVSGAYCSPTRAGLLTGRYQTRFGHEFNPGGTTDGTEIGLPLSETTIADRLRAAGYATGLVGKWHLGNAAQFHPQKRGFDEFFGFLGGMHTYFAEATQTVYRGTTPVVEKEYLTDAFAREAVAFVEKHKSEPFFLYLAFNAVHTPLDATPDRLKKFEHISDERRRSYAAMLVALDEAIGRVLTTLREQGLEENTLIFFFSDNGGPTMPTTSINGSRNTPLRGSKRTTLEGGIRVPFVIHWKGHFESGRVVDSPIIQLDIVPTALAAAGISLPDESALDGTNLLPFLEGKTQDPPHRTLYWRFGDQRAIRHEQWKLVQYDETADQTSEQAEEARKSNRSWPNITSAKLYDLSQDVGEANDLAQSHPEKVEELERLWQAWNDQLVPPLWGGKSVRNAGQGTTQK